MSKVTLVFGASLNPQRYSYKAIYSLVSNQHNVVAFGLRKGTVHDVEIVTDLPIDAEIDTVTLYINPKRQIEYYQYLVKLNPRRIIFNPGTENGELIQLLEEEGIITEVACTLVLLSVGNY